MDLSNTSKIVLAFITLLLGVVLVGVIADQNIAVTAKTNVANETLDISSARLGDGMLSIDPTVEFTITNNPTGWKSTDCPITDFVFRNQTQVDTTETTDYVLDTSTGVLTLVNSSAFRIAADTFQDLNITTMEYVYCQDDYLNLSWGRTVINLVGGFFALALLLVSVALFFDVAKANGIIK